MLPLVHLPSSPVASLPLTEPHLLPSLLQAIESTSPTDDDNSNRD
jgi:hypothetical protein